MGFKMENCKNCEYFYSCQVNGAEVNEYCTTNPDVLGYCELWSGPIINYSVCHGWTAHKRFPSSRSL